MNGYDVMPIIEKCVGCERVLAVLEPHGFRCLRYANPETQWRRGNCPGATHVKTMAVEAGKKLNPLKASKRGEKQ